ncbi:sigma factor [Candidatus Agathobaculum pullicola]|uniref:sigma factor n=1 Tax=Candidatus Agathobaculum pullicola TaxID=2838426 RepID=UPI003F9225E1
MKNQTNEQLCALAQKGGIGACSLLVEQNLGFLRKTAGELYRSINLAQSDLCVDCEDLVQEGSIGLLSAAVGGETARGIKFLTYTAPAIRNAMTDFIRAKFAQFEQKVVHGENELGIQIIRLEEVRSEEEQA